ncbi:hypothetical protein ARMGADRAFT_568847 [Armillaria gallica]|uniref:Uncharacterized protein n=1 Tax=Armillaria gallica TaxID=47427 RepID=A0A2H3EFC7_ARMGA|nr:hypothetical protein ARMGADRAFT_568847 [Armillaria gallica]
MYRFAVKVSDPMYKLILSLLIFLPGWAFVRSWRRVTSGAKLQRPVRSCYRYGLVLVMTLLKYPDMVGRPYRRPSYIGNGKWRGECPCGMEVIFLARFPNSWFFYCDTFNSSIPALAFITINIQLSEMNVLYP